MKPYKTSEFYRIGNLLAEVVSGRDGDHCVLHQDRPDEPEQTISFGASTFADLERLLNLLKLRWADDLETK